MARSRAVPALLVAVLGFFAAPPAWAPFDTFRTGVKFSKAVQLADGSVLKANVPYEFQINFAGTGNTAEFEFILPGGKHVKQSAEAVGFPAAAGNERFNVAENIKARMKEGQTEWDYYALEQKGASMEWVKLKFVSPQDEYKYKIFKGGDLRSADKSSLYLKISMKEVLVGRTSPESFSWGAAGFGPTTHPTATEERGLIIVVCKSSNSPAFFRAQFKEAKPAGQK